MTAPTTYYVRNTSNYASASDTANGGTSATVLATGLTATGSSATTLVSTTGVFSAAMVGQLVNINSASIYIINAYTSATTVTIAYFSGASFSGATGLSFVVGGPFASINAAFNIPGNTATSASTTVYVGAGVYRNSTTLSLYCYYLNVIGDTTGAYTGDAGEVIASWYSADTGASGYAGNAATFYSAQSTISNITWIGGAGSTTNNSYIFATQNPYIASGTGISANTANTYTISGQSWATNQWAGYIFEFGNSTGLIISNTSNVLTFATSLNNPTAYGSGTVWYIFGQLTFQDCVFNGLASTSNITMSNTVGTGNVPYVLYDRCIFLSKGTTNNAPISPYFAFGGSIIIQNCLIMGWGGTNHAGIWIRTSGSYQYPNMCYINNCTIFGGAHGVYTNTNNGIASMVNVSNSFISGSLYGGYCNGTVNVINDAGYNQWFGSTLLTGITLAGTSYVNYSGNTSGSSPTLDFGQWFKISNQNKPFASPSNSSPLLGFGNASVTYSGTAISAPTYDFLNRPRPSGGGSSKYAIGYVERHDFAIQDLANYPSGYTASGKLVGPGDQQVYIAVDAVSHTFAVQVLQSFSGSSTVSILANPEIGVTAQTLTNSTSGFWQTLTFSSIFPTQQGYITLQVTSKDTTGTGTLNFGAIV
jgi:hypothetical protein